ncbi:MAG: flagellar basal body-associated FliL family protein [Lachnospiraceae bacterium]|nr:flagellar basal body-associated FliL family protein [Lachnospiraceae bacterium]
MKRNLILVIIVALVLVNIVLSTILLVSTMSANNKTKALINDIAAVLDLEMNPQVSGGAAAGPSLLDTETYNIEDEMVITLAPSGDGVDHYAMVSVSLSLDKTNPDYATMQPLVAASESKIKSEIIDVVGGYTKEEVSENPNVLQQAILKRVQDMFGSTFIYEVYFRDIKAQ